MGQSRRSSPIVRSIVLLLGGVALGALWKGRAPESEVLEPEPALPSEPAPRPVPRQRPFGRRLGIAAAFVTLFVAGGALTAWGGNQASQLVEEPAAGAPVEAAATVETPPAEPAPATTAEAAPAPASVAPELQRAEEPALSPAADVAAPAAPESVPAAAPPPTPVAVQPPVRVAPVAVRQHAVTPRRVAHVVRVPKAVAPDPETAAPGLASVSRLNGARPDPTPPSRRLQRQFLRSLYHAAGTNWALELGVLHAEGAQGRFPAGRARMGTLAERIAQLQAEGSDDRQAALALTGDAALAERAVALGHYYRAVGTETLAVGLDGSKARLARRLLADPRVVLYPAGRDDVQTGRVNVRVLGVIAYLADTFGRVDVSSVVRDRPLYARQRAISAHAFGEAVDVAALGGQTIVGHQEPGGLTEQAVRALLLVPAEVEPRQIISLLALGGPSFALADHADHIHVGF